ncbi:Protein H03E18.1 [Aphelenchoides avenae]|nr:Protein H03E18.1 [Aphelenchus avenae]
MFDLEEITTTQPLTLAPEPEPSTSAEQGLARSGGDNGPVDPIVVNGRLLTSGEAKALASYERTTTTTTTVTPPWKPAGAFGETSAGDASVPDQSDNTDDERESRQKTPEQLDEGFVNTFFIKGLSSMFKGDEKDFQRQRERALTTSTTPAPIVCYRLIPQQLLLYAGYRTHAGVTLNQCRCLCAETWRDENSSENKCKSVQYDEKKKECTLNEADHNGKYDLIYNKNVDYHYVSCDVQFLLSTGARMCHWNEKSISEDGKSVDKEHPVVFTTTTTHSTIDVPESRLVSPSEKHISEAVSSSSGEWTTTTSAPKLTTKPTKSDVKSVSETANSSKAEFTTEKPDRRKHPQATTTKKTTKVPSSTPTPQTTVASTKATATTTVQTTYLTTTIDNPQTEKPSVEESDIPKLPEAATGDKDVKLITTNRTMPSDMMKEKAKKESKKASKAVTTTIEPVQKKPDLEVKVSGCFEVIEGHVMRGTAGGLEHDVTLEECECFCANSLASRRYVFQCLSATYYHRERDCILNVDNRQVHPEVFEKNEQEEYNVTYLGMTCGIDKARVVHVDDTLPNGCLRETTPATTTTTAKTTTTPAHSDDCFLELPNYVLEGQALAIENNVTVEECKCYCVDSEHRYGSECQSVQYFYDSGTCLLNKENRITDPDRFSYDPHGGVMSSYFDYRCHAEKMVLSVYVEQICQQIVDIKISDVIKMTTAASLDKEEGANEVRSVTRVIDTPLSEENTSDQLEAIALKSHSAEHEGRIVKEITDTMPATTTTASTTTTARGLKKMTSNAATTPISSTTTVTSTSTSTEATTTAVKKKAKTALTKNVSPKKLATTTSTTTSKPENATTTTLPETAENATASDATNETLSTTLPATNATEKTTASTVPTTSSTTTAPTTSAERKTKKLTKSTEAATPLPFDSEEGASEEELPTKPPPPPRRPSRPVKKGRRPLVTTPKPIPEREELESGEFGQQELEAETTEPPTTTTTGYQPVGPCRYSALYQTVFNGGRLIKRLMVTSPAQCFAACHHERCRSANLIQSEGVLKVCELFRDSIVDFRRTDVLGFDRGAVHFDSIQCEELSQ